MTSNLPGFGAFGFGVIIGWFVYFTNRYRTGEVQFSDLATLLGIIGGAAVTALFGPASATLFGAYGLGLFVGFFGYFVTLILLVRASDGAFGWTWFLDGRRRKLAEDEEIPGETRRTTAPMSMRPMPPDEAAAPGGGRDRPSAAVGPRQAFPAAPAAGFRSPLAEAVEQRDRAIAAVVEALRDLQRRIGDTTDDAQRARLHEASERLTLKHDELIALRLRDILDSAEVRGALARLGGITSDLAEEARAMKATADALAAAARVIDRATRVIGFFGGLFA